MFRPRLAALVLTVLLTAVAAPATRAEMAPEARPVIERFVQASGGRAVVDSVHATYTHARITAFGLHGTTESWTRRPDSRASATELGPFKLRDGYDGNRGWRTDPSGKLVMLDGKDLEDARSNAWFENERWLDPDQGGGTIAFVGHDRDSTGAYDVLEVTPPVGRGRKVWFDSKTGLIARMQEKNDARTVVSTISDYRPVAGRLMAFHTHTEIVGMPANALDVTADSIALDPEIADARFQPPAPGLEPVTWLGRPGVAHVPFRYGENHVWVRASINGRPPEDYLFDTGASVTVVDSTTAVRLGLPREGLMQGQGAGSAGTASFSRLDSVRIEGPDGDGVVLRNLKIAVLSVSHDLAPFFWRDIPGVIGYDVISRFVTTIDYDDSTLTLTDPATYHYQGGGTTLPFTLAGTVPAVQAKLDDRYEGRFRVDVGSGSTVDLHTPFVKRNDLLSKVGKSLEATGGGFGGTFTSRIARMKRFELGPYAWSDPLVHLSEATSGAFASEDYAGNIGNGILERFRCTFDYERRELHLEPGKRFGERDPFSRCGALFGRFGDVVRAMVVLDGSPAARAGMVENDEVVSLDGKPMLSFTPDALRKLFERGKPGTSHVFVVRRGTHTRKLKVTLRDIL